METTIDSQLVYGLMRISVTSKQSTNLNVYNGTKLLVVFKFPIVVRHGSLVSLESDLQLLAWTEDGAIYLCPVERAWLDIDAGDIQGKAQEQDVFRELIQPTTSALCVGEDIKVINVSENCMIHKTLGLEDAKILNRTLITISSCQGEYDLCIYDLPVPHPPSLTCLGSVRVHQNKHLFGTCALGTEDSMYKPCLHARLFCIKPDSHTLTTSSSAVSSMSKELYNTLFGMDTNLMESCVLLILTPSGLVQYLTLKNILGGFDGSPGGATCQVLYDLEQPAMAAMMMELHAEKEEEERMKMMMMTVAETERLEGLALVGSEGRVVLITKGTAKDFGVSYRECFVPGPVVGTCSVQHWILHSTGRELFRTDLSLLWRGRAPIRSLSEPLGYGGILSLAAWKVDPSLPGPSSLSGAHALAVTSRGQILQPILHDPDGKKSSPHSSVCGGGQGIKGLLVSMNSVADQVKVVKCKLQRQNTVLNQLNIASNLASRGEILVQVDTHVRSHDTGVQTDYVLICRLTNISEVTLDGHWSFLVTMVLKDSNKDSSCSQVAKSIYLGSFSPGNFREVHFSVTGEVLNNLPLELHPFLIFNMHDFDEAQLKLSDSPLEESIPILLRPQTIDVVHFLQSPSEGHQKSSARHVKQVADILIEIARKQPGSSKATPAEHLLSEGYLGSHSVAVPVSQEAAQAAAKQHSPKGTRIEIGLMRYILANSQVSLEGISQTRLSLVSPHGHQVVLSVKRSEARGYDLLLQAPSMHLLCSLRMAVSGRLEMVKTSKKAASLPQDFLQRTQAQLQELKMESLSIQDTLIEHSIPTSEISQRVMQLYKQLRSLPRPTTS